MSEEERKKLIITFTNFINSNFPLVKGMYDLFKNGKGNLYLYENKIELEATNFNKIEKPQDILTTTMLLMYISMKQLEKPDAKEIVVKEEEFEEIILYCDFLKENNKSFIEFLDKEEK